MTVPIEALRSVSAFAALSESELHALASTVERWHYPAGATLEGAFTNGELFVVVSGALTITAKSSAHSRLCAPGAAFGLDLETIVAVVSDCELLSVDERALRALATREPTVRAWLLAQAERWLSWVDITPARHWVRIRLELGERAEVTSASAEPAYHPTPHERGPMMGSADEVEYLDDDVDESDTCSSLLSSRGAVATASIPGNEATIASGGHLYRVWFGTNRKPKDRKDAACGFSGARARKTTLGSVDVWVPEAHRFGETGTSFFTRLWRRDLRDDHLRVRGILHKDAEVFWAELKTAMRDAAERGDAPDALVFIHGYNTSFEDAAIRAAQIGVDLQVPGATAFFSWPSRARAGAYPADEASIEASEGALEDFLVTFSERSGAHRVHVIAHSMGNRGLLRALTNLAASSSALSKLRFGQVLLAAPDVDRDLFMRLAHVYRACSERTTLYASSADLAVRLSARFHEAPRAGYFLPYTTVDGIDSIAVPDFDLDLLGHGYFAKAGALLHDIYDLLRHNAPPPRQRMTRAQHDGVTLWRLML
jgi:esterase/lipase superfamily enzyme